MTLVQDQGNTATRCGIWTVPIAIDLMAKYNPFRRDAAPALKGRCPLGVKDKALATIVDKRKRDSASAAGSSASGSRSASWSTSSTSVSKRLAVPKPNLFIPQKP